MKRSPLHELHLARQAKLVPFGGWEMPVSYPLGTIEEHLRCRNDAAVFDVSHLGTVRVEGVGSFDRLQGALTNDLRKISSGRAQYTHLLDPSDASVTDDIIVWWVDEHRFDVMPNATNTDGVRAAIGGVDVTGERAVLAVQGPNARARVGDLWPEAAAVARFHVAECSWNGVTCVVAGTGYTGEDGIEIAVPVAAAADLWRALESVGVTPAGLGARDTLRLEAGLPLHGHELGPGITPLQAGLGWVVGWDKGPFIGRERLDAERSAGVHRRLYGLATEGRRPPRSECEVRRPNGSTIGMVTSGNFSPVLQHGIALAFLTPDVVVGDVVQIDVRGALLDARVVPLPFVGR